MTGTRKSSRKRLAPSWGGEAPLASSTLTAAALGRFGTLVEFIVIWIRNLTEFVRFYPVRKNYLSFFFWPRFYIVVLRIVFFYVTSTFHIFLDFYFPFLFGLLFPFFSIFSTPFQFLLNYFSFRISSKFQSFIKENSFPTSLLEGHTLITLSCWLFLPIIDQLGKYQCVSIFTK